ncbi:MAG: hypothetical protein VKK80_00015 [Prochlorothrix sp.]|nr:hypothetical protein [Prochlorothrix sp.]
MTASPANPDFDDLTLASVLADLDRIQQAHRQVNPNLSAIEQVRLLRAYTRSDYTNRLWALTAGKIPEPLLDLSLDRSVHLAQHPVDFAHFIAALSDQFPGGSLQSALYDLGLSTLSRVLALQLVGTSDFTSTLGDLGQPIETYLHALDHPQSLHFEASAFQTLLQGQASAADFNADLLAYHVAQILRRAPTQSVAGAIRFVSRTPYPQTVQLYVKERLGGQLQAQGSHVLLSNPKQVSAQLQRQLKAYLSLKFLVDRHLGWAQRVIRGDRRLMPFLEAAVDHFFNYLTSHGNLRLPDA